MSLVARSGLLRRPFSAELMWEVLCSASISIGNVGGTTGGGAPAAPGGPWGGIPDPASILAARLDGRLIGGRLGRCAKLPLMHRHGAIGITARALRARTGAGEKICTHYSAPGAAMAPACFAMS